MGNPQVLPNIPPPPAGFVPDTSTGPSTVDLGDISSPSSAPSGSVPPPPPGFVPDNSFSTPSGNTYTPGQQVVHDSGVTGQITGQNPQTNKAEVKWYNTDAQGQPIRGDENGQAHTIRANDPQNTGTAIGRWAEQVQNDIKYGTDFTGIGKVLNKLGAHGVDVGNPEGVGDFMASIPLGILKAVQGQAQMAGATTPGQAVQGVKNLVGGELKAGTMPSMVVGGPEGEAALDAGSAAASKGAEIASDAAKAGTKTVGKVARKVYPAKIELPNPAEARQSTQPIYDALHQQVRDVVAKAAQNAGVAVKDTDSIQDVASTAAKALKAKASNLYSQIDDALTSMSDTGEDMEGRYQAIDENISKLKKKVGDLIGEPEKQQAMQESLDAENAKKQVIVQKLKDAGIGHLPDEASAAHRQAKAMEDFGAKVQRNTTGLPGHPDLPERLNPQTFANSLNTLKNSTKFGGNRLKQALGDGADELIQHTNDAKAALQTHADEAAAQAAKAKSVNIKRRIVQGLAATAAAKATGVDKPIIHAAEAIF
jgi:hypothetical protein